MSNESYESLCLTEWSGILTRRYHMTIIHLIPIDERVLILKKNIPEELRQRTGSGNHDDRDRSQHRALERPEPTSSQHRGVASHDALSQCREMERCPELSFAPTFATPFSSKSLTTSSCLITPPHWDSTSFSFRRVICEFVLSRLNHLRGAR